MIFKHQTLLTPNKVQNQHLLSLPKCVCCCSSHDIAETETEFHCLLCISIAAGYDKNSDTFYHGSRLVRTWCQNQIQNLPVDTILYSQSQGCLISLGSHINTQIFTANANARIIIYNLSITQIVFRSQTSNLKWKGTENKIYNLQRLESLSCTSLSSLLTFILLVMVCGPNRAIRHKKEKGHLSIPQLTC